MLRRLSIFGFVAIVGFIVASNFLVPMAAQNEFIFGADSGFLPAGAGANNNSVGTATWTNPGNVTADDAAFAFVSCHTVTANAQNSVRLFIGGSPAGDNKSTGALWPNGDVTHGGAADTWGLTPTPGQINAADFGIGYSVTGNVCTSQYLYASTFGFSIPADATINGIETVAEATAASSQARVDFVEIKVYYTPGGLVEQKVQVRTGRIDISTGRLDLNE